MWVADYKNSLDKKRSQTVEKGGKRGNAKEKEKLWKKKKALQKKKNSVMDD